MARTAAMSAAPTAKKPTRYQSVRNASSLFRARESYASLNVDWKASEGKLNAPTS
jgi:hypothetical protein